MAEIWRLLITPPAAGNWNMAVDELLLAEVGSGQQPPTLRLYAWQVPCLSLGHAQPAADADHDRLRALGWGLVRRLSGGRAILHTDELTYALVLPANHPLAGGSVVESYRRLSQALLAALSGLGGQVRADPKAPEAQTGAICFEVPSDYEITANGRKLVGSAQVRKMGGVLQHGTLPLMGDLGRISDVLAYPHAAARQAAREAVVARAITLDHVLGRPVPWEEASLAMVDGFARTFSPAWQPMVLSPDQLTHVEDILHTRYASILWTLKF
jgi:lipoyl(octanoyl) transferase